MAAGPSASVPATTGPVGDVTSAVKSMVTNKALSAAGKAIAPTAAPVAEGAAATSTLAKIAAAAGPVGVAFAAVTAAAVGAAIGIKLLISAFRSQTEKLSGFSGEVAVAQAQTEIRETRTTIRRAERIGPAVAEWENRGSKLDSAMSNLGTEVYKGLDAIADPVKEIVEASTNIIELATSGLEVLNAIAEKNGVLKEVLIALNPLSVVAKGVNGLFNLAKKDKDEEELVDPFVDAFFLAAERRAGVAVTPEQLRRPDGQLPPAGALE
jgi:hypothetical protein